MSLKCDKAILLKRIRTRKITHSVKERRKKKTDDYYYKQTFNEYFCYKEITVLIVKQNQQRFKLDYKYMHSAQKNNENYFRISDIHRSPKLIIVLEM